MFIEAKDDGGGGDDNWTTGAIRRAKLQSDHHHQQTNNQFFYRPDALSVAQPCQSTEGKISHSMVAIFYSPEGIHAKRVAMPLISPLMPVPLDRGSCSVFKDLQLGL